MKKYKEIRRLTASDLRSLCIEKDWYTGGTNEEYSHLLLDLAGLKENLTSEDIILIAEDIAAHSNLESGYEIEDVAYEVARKAYSFFEEVKTEYQVMMCSGGGTRRLLTSFESEEEAVEYCELYDLKWVDPDSAFEWYLEIDEKS